MCCMVYRDDEGSLVNSTSLTGSRAVCLATRRRVQCDPAAKSNVRRQRVIGITRKTAAVGQYLRMQQRRWCQSILATLSFGTRLSAFERMRKLVAIIIIIMLHADVLPRRRYPLGADDGIPKECVTISGVKTWFLQQNCRCRTVAARKWPNSLPHVNCGGTK